MRGKIIAVSIIILLFGTQMLAAQTPGTDVPGNIRNNRYFLESVRLANLAEQAYEEGDYDASTVYSQEAVRYAELSDEFVRHQLKMKEADDAIAAARKRLDYATSVNAATRYQLEYGRAQVALAEARAFRAADKLDEAIDAANRVLAALAYVSAEEAPPPPTPAPAAPPPIVPDTPGLPARYIVRTWSDYRDCLWNIAAQPWVYNDPWKWKVLYEANKSKLPDASNPNLILPGMVMDIPSIKGETRQGTWEAGKGYKTFQ